MEWSALHTFMHHACAIHPTTLRLSQSEDSIRTDYSPCFRTDSVDWHYMYSGTSDTLGAGFLSFVERLSLESATSLNG